jgi:SAM-dependent methyltransferase
MTQQNTLSQKSIWEHRYKNDVLVSKWPFNQIISMVMNRFATCPDRSKTRILDYGCGGGGNFWFLAREGFSAYACDISPSALAMTQSFMVKENITLPDDHFCLLEGERLPYPDGFFSAIIDRESLCQSSWEEIQSRVREFHRILAPGGWYLGINFTCQTPDVRHAEHMGHGDWHNFREGPFKDQGQRHLFSINDIAYLFSQWHIESVYELTSRSCLGSKQNLAISEYMIQAQKIYGSVQE